MTMLTAPSSVTEGLYLLAHILATTAIPGPYHIGYSILADNDAEGTAAIDRIGLELEKAGINHHVEDTDHHREVVIPLADRLEYRIVYVFRAAMDTARRRDSYRDNIA
jgi:hypothetical protein